MARGFHKPGDVENRLEYYLGQITARQAATRRDTQFRDVEDGRQSKPISTDMFQKSVI